MERQLLLQLPQESSANITAKLRAPGSASRCGMMHVSALSQRPFCSLACFDRVLKNILTQSIALQCRSVKKTSRTKYLQRSLWMLNGNTEQQFVECLPFYSPPPPPLLNKYKVIQQNNCPITISICLSKSNLRQQHEYVGLTQESIQVTPRSCMHFGSLWNRVELSDFNCKTVTAMTPYR